MTKNSSKHLFRKSILGINPYSAPLDGRKSDDILLDFNERTTHPHTLVLEELRSYFKKGNLQLYPSYEGINEIVSDYVGVKPNEIILTVGSDQGIDIINRALVDKGDKVIIPTPTFAMLEQSALLQGANIISPKYKGQNYEFPFEQVMKEIKKGVKLVVLCKPNNPTGTPISKEQSEKIIKKAEKVGAGVLADEAYHEYAPKHTVIDLLDKYPNLFITRTFSKTMGIPSLRAGVVISQKQNIDQLVKVRGPYDVGMTTVIALKSLRHKEVREDIKKYTDEIMNISKPMVEKFYNNNGIKFVPSVANFHLIIPPYPDFTEFLKTQGILVRPRSDIPGTVRVSIGTRKNTEQYIKAFKEFTKLR